MNAARRLMGMLAVLGAMCARASGHGRLVEPPSRASAWRYGFDTPHNYNDHELYCGGFTRQWNRNGGRCGVCGDAWDAPAPRPHELGGHFGRGVIVRRYAPGDAIAVRVELTASHMGFFEFRVCEEPKATTQDCLDRHLLKLDDKNSTKYFPREGNKMYEMKYRLPDQLECAHCVLQWKYIAGNNWGTCENGTGAVGCGPQEEFRACADIAIGQRFATSTRRPRPEYVPSPGRPVAAPPAAPPAGHAAHPAWYALAIALATLLAALSALAGIYLYYYRCGAKIKNFLKSKAAHAPTPAPLPPPPQEDGVAAQRSTDQILTEGYCRRGVRNRRPVLALRHPQRGAIAVRRGGCDETVPCPRRAACSRCSRSTRAALPTDLQCCNIF